MNLEEGDQVAVLVFRKEAVLDKLKGIACHFLGLKVVVCVWGGGGRGGIVTAKHSLPI